MRIALLALAALLGSMPAGAAGDECDRFIPREQAAMPDVTSSPWTLIDEGTFTFHYRFYGQKRGGPVEAVIVAGEREPGLLEVKLSVQKNGEILVFMLGPVADQQKIPVCVRSLRGGFDLDRLYQTLKPRLRR